jgi:hypothetical protein
MRTIDLGMIGELYRIRRRRELEERNTPKLSSRRGKHLKSLK